MSTAIQTGPANWKPLESADRTMRRARVLELVYEVTRAINSSLNLDEVTEFIYQGISRILPTANFYIAFPSSDGKEIEFAIEIERRLRRPARSRPIGAGLTEHLLSSKRPLLIAREFERACHGFGITFEGAPAKCWMGAPMVFRDRAVGVIAIQSYEAEGVFDSEHLSVLENLASQAAAAVENARLYQQLKTSYDDLQATQQRLLQSEKLAAVGQLISGIAHELNNPLTGVVGWTQFLLGQTLPTQIRAHLGTINEQSQRAARIVQNLLTFARQHKPEKSSVSLNDVVESTLALRAYELRVNNIEVERKLDPALGPIHADPHQLQQVVLNLIMNAEQAMLNSPAHGGTLTIETSADARQISLSVADNGPGITDGLLKKIFDPFFTTKPIGQGTGLGLSISYGIIEEHGGRIWAENQPDSGAIFHISLPGENVTLASHRPALLEAAPLKAAPAFHVLIVDDEESVRDLLTAVLESESVAIDTAGTGEEALERAAQSHYDLILTDLKMPGLSGSSFYDRLSARLLEETPRFVFMTGDVLGIDTQKLLERTRSACILKPFDIFQARELIRETLAETSTPKTKWRAQSARA